MTIFFPDVSHYQQGLSLSGAVACIAKATEGTSYSDPAYAGFKAQAAKLGIPFCAYHWIHASDVAGQARHCFNVVGPAVPLMIDDEDTRDGLSIDRTLQFVRAYRALGGTVTLEYLPRWFWSNHGSPDLRPLAQAGLSLVSSNYGGYSDIGVGWLPYGGVAPKIWQYTSSQVFNGYKCDFNAFKGTVAELRALFAGGQHIDQETEDDMLIRVNETGAIWTVDLPRLWRRYIDGPEFEQTWKGQPLTAVPQAQLDGGWWGRDIASVAKPGSAGGGPTHDELVAAAEEGANLAEDN